MIVADWIANSFPIIRIIFIVLLGLCSIAMVISIFLQPAAADGMGALSGQASDTYFSKNKEKNFEGFMKRLTVILGIAIAVIAILFFITIRIYAPT
ncbi:MAG: preprotein translocase subunit SecG [Firmicutes bacterium]|nr:preprotein translocase subunit SecG [Bacillota bacterium]